MFLYFFLTEKCGTRIFRSGRRIFFAQQTPFGDNSTTVSRGAPSGLALGEVSLKYMENEIIQIEALKEEIEKLRSQFYIFYELTKAMRTTLRFDEVVYIILTGLTAHQGLAFNRGILFVVDEANKKINGFMGIGPMDNREAHGIWQHIEKENKDLYDLIKNYRRVKEDNIKPKFMELVESLSFPLSNESGILFDVLIEKSPLHIKGEKLEKFKNNGIITQLQLKEFLISSLWIKDKPEAIIIVDNCVTQKPISEEDVRIFNMFVEQAMGAVENSQEFEDTLIKAHTDSLTGLWNHGYFQYKLDEEIEKTKTQGKTMSMMMVDLDNFKKFNDTFGHIQGDSALKKISEILKESSRKADILCRYGGEEFSLIVPTAGKDEALNLAERIRKSVQDKEILGNRFTVSIGIASFPIDAGDKRTLVRKSDEALYEAKKRGKNQIVLA